ncbi:hypothetical protein [Selenomonas ruminis]|uniref:Uncharacterized protein n=1 Tax=Selenomonas ruminis TaxID=2593411 RepID=A0A5D6VXX0_9FIRM|nr:hypothetical protein [Selenomonas sp. mPRGC5]TYZ20506.1 hypothetical protein FZ040_11865 [Selenomonas sp. mPRGC5]
MLPITRLEQRSRSLAAVNRQIEDLEVKQRTLERELSQESQTVKMYQHVLEVYKAGLIFKEAGILGIYDHDKVLQILQDYKREANLS